MTFAAKKLRAAIPPSWKYPVRRMRDFWHDRDILSSLTSRGEVGPEPDLDALKQGIVSFVESMALESEGVRYRYSGACTQATLYASAYACMTFGLLGKLSALPAAKKRAWADYFDSFQNPDDGLFYDPAVRNGLYDNNDWWGARHLALHMIIAYTNLGATPRHRFGFLKPYCDPAYLQAWLDGFDWSGLLPAHSDIDNKIMNVGCLLQFQRDTWNDTEAGEGVEHLKRILLAKLDPGTGMWGRLGDIYARSRMVQFAYHVLPIFFYDGHNDFAPDTIIPIVLATQNRLGGYGVKLNSSACEDIDSIDILLRLSGLPDCPERLRRPVKDSITRARSWIMRNRMADGGFVFRINEPYGMCHEQFSSARNTSALFPTWFRLLSLAYIDRWSGGSSFSIDPAPGYVVPLNVPAADGRSAALT